jgi:hypothetical protein
MEKNNNTSLNNHNISLQLRSKEVSEVMGNIPSWVGVWGTIIIFLLFTISVLLIFNIHCVERMNGKATIIPQHVSIMPGTISQDYFLQVVIPMTKNNKIKAGQKVTLSFHGEKNYVDKLSGITFLIDKITINKDSYVLRVVENNDTIKKMTLYNQALLNKVAGCELVSDITVFEKVFGLLF